MRLFRCVAAAFAAVCCTPAIHSANLQCDVAIIGGGPGGVHTAYKLTTQHLTKGSVCLFEMSDHLGGRVGNNNNVGFSGSPFVNNGVPVQNSGQTGTGGYRMYFNQYTYKLGQELAALGQPGQLTFLAQNSFSRLATVVNRHFNSKFTEPIYFTYNNGGVAKFFAPLYNSPINDNDIWKVLLCGPQVPVDSNSTPQYQKMSIPGLGGMSTADYLEWVSKNVISPNFGPEVAQYLLDTWRFRGDFDTPNDAVSYLEYNAKDYTGGTIYYPIPSFQPYFDIMQAQINSHGGQIFLNEKVLSLNRSGAAYILTTGKGNTVTANTVVIATNHSALDASKGGMTGDVVSDIVAQPQYQYVQTSNAVTVTHQFGDGKNPLTGWWRGDITYPGGSNLLGPQLSPSSNPLRRTTNNVLIPGEKLPGCQNTSCDFSNTMFFNNTNELPLTDYHDFINISRSVYNDKSDAVDNWVALYNAGETLSPGGGGNAAINRQILKSLRLMYPTVFTGNPKTEPPILATHLTVHKPAWYNLKQGALAHSITNDNLFAWSLSPLPADRVYLVGDSWRTDVSGWSDAAYKGSVYVLNKYFGAKIDPKEESTIKCIKGDIVDPN
jgi:NAD(P)-binding Rossmann-like domain/Flavin containing amine oxidoreductase